MPSFLIQNVSSSCTTLFYTYLERCEFLPVGYGLSWFSLEAFLFFSSTFSPNISPAFFSHITGPVALRAAEAAVRGKYWFSRETILFSPIPDCYQWHINTLENTHVMNPRVCRVYIPPLQIPATASGNDCHFSLVVWGLQDQLISSSAPGLRVATSWYQLS